MVPGGRANAGFVTTSLVVMAFLPFVIVPPAAAQDGAARPSLSQPAKPLAEALRKFAQDSGYDAVFQESLVEGRRSAPVHDARNAHDALNQMLAGSGLVPRFTRPNAFILEVAGATAPAALSLERIEVVAPAVREREAAYRWYGEKLLEASLATLRRSPEMGMRAYDFTIYVYLSERGTIIDLEAGDASGQSDVLQSAARMLKGLAVGIVPPADMPQPVGLRISAQ